MRPVVLVGRAEQDVDAERGDVDRPVRGEVDGVGPGERACRVGELDHPRDVDERPDRVGGEREGDDSRPIGELPLQVGEVEPALVVDVREADDQVAVTRELEPGRDAAVVVEAGHDDLVAGAQLAPCRARQGEVQRRHVRPEGGLVGRAAEEPACDVVRARDQLERVAGRVVVGRPEVRVRVAQVPGDRVDHLVRRLRPGRRVEEREWAVERREARPHRRHVERGQRHAMSTPFTCHR